MSVKLDITLQDRKKMTVGELNKLKKEGLIPGIIYGKNFLTRSVFIDRKNLMKLLLTSLEEHIFFNINIEGEKEYFTAIIQDKQWDVIKQEIRHVDFKKIDMNEEIELYSEFRFNGIAKGVRQGGIMEVRFSKIKGKSLPMNYPKYLDCNISNLEIGSVLRMKDIKLPEELKIDFDPETVLVAITTPKAERGQASAPETDKKEQPSPEKSSEKSNDKPVPKTTVKNTKKTAKK
ncbi:MAG: 50S ribosomal protein L25 [Elusimicrobiota bacterium]|jgi:large subunit ribosomal protein L25|nr:50S ribosomal protein L25 [Elusimicrobiota bacterium]